MLRRQLAWYVRNAMVFAIGSGAISVNGTQKEIMSQEAEERKAKSRELAGEAYKPQATSPGKPQKLTSGKKSLEQTYQP